MLASAAANRQVAPAGRQVQPTRTRASSLRKLPQVKGLNDPRYQYVQDAPGLKGVAISSRVPPEESFTLRYVTERIMATVALVYTGILTRIALRITKNEDADMDNLADFKKYFPPFKIKVFFDLIPIPLPIRNQDRFIQLPKVADIYEADDVFGEHRLAGMNPAMIRKLTPDDPRAATIKYVKGGADALAAGKAFVVDYTGLPVGDEPPDWPLQLPVQGGEYVYKGETLRKALPLPIAFFKWDDSVRHGRLMPLCIQLYKDSRLYTPEDEKYDWLFAKLAFNIADGNHHEMVSHLGHKHFFMEAFAIAIRRCLDDTHPLSLLLRAHTRFLIANNSLGRDTLVVPGGSVDELLAGTLEESVEMSRQGVLNSHFVNDSFPKSIEIRGVGKDDLPRYPYRDNGEKLWEAIESFVTEYLSVKYASDEEVKADAGVQLFCKELSDPTMGAVNGMPKQAHTLKELVFIVTSIIFISGPDHCAVNYTQHPVASFVPNQPLAARDPYRELSKRERGNSLTEKDIIKMLPNEGMVSNQQETMYTLCAYKFDKFGEYDRPFDSLFDLSTAEVFAELPKGDSYLKAITNFQAKLAEAEVDIMAMNTRSPITGEDYLIPSEIINSTSI